MPKPWPEKPVPMVRPGIASTGEITGIASGVTSISPAQDCATSAPSSTGKARRAAAQLRRSTRSDGAGSRMRTCSKGVTSSGRQWRASAASSLQRPETRKRSDRHSARKAGQKARARRKLSGTRSTVFSVPDATV